MDVLPIVLWTLFVFGLLGALLFIPVFVTLWRRGAIKRFVSKIFKRKKKEELAFDESPDTLALSRERRHSSSNGDLFPFELPSPDRRLSMVPPEAEDALKQLRRTSSTPSIFHTHIPPADHFVENEQVRSPPWDKWTNSVAKLYYSESMDVESDTNGGNGLVPPTYEADRLSPSMAASYGSFDEKARAAQTPVNSPVEREQPKSEELGGFEDRRSPMNEGDEKE